MKRLLALLLLAPTLAIAAPPTAVLTWTAPTLRQDGSPLTGALTYNVYQGASGAETKLSIPAVTALIYTATGSSGATLCWKVSAVDSNGLEGALSNEACKTFPASPPSAPVLTVN
jgi:fibronectin type 3 domain-containing protein